MTNKEIISSLRGLIGKYNLTDEEWQTVEKTIKVLNNSDKDCISRKDAEMCLTANITNMTIEEYISMVGDRLKGLSSIQPTAKENLVVEGCISREFIEIVVDYPPADLCTYPEYRGKPYFSIKYRENGKTYVGFGTYKIEMLSQWIKEYFMPSIQPKTGQWEILPKSKFDSSTNEHIRCTNCGKEPFGDIPYPFCPYCGEPKMSENPTDSEKE